MSGGTPRHSILLLNYEFPPLGGGAGNATKYLCKEFAHRSDIAVDVITASADSDRIEKYAEHITIYYLDVGKKGKNLHYQTYRQLLTYSWRAYWFSRSRMQKRSYSLVHAFFGIPCGCIAFLLRLPYIVSIRGSDVPFYNKRFHVLDLLLFSHISRLVWKHAYAVIANSQELKRLAHRTIPDQHISVIPNGVDTGVFVPIQKNQGTVLSLISVGRLIPRKGYTYLLEAIEGLSVELTLVGDGPSRIALKELAHEKDVSVHFAGAVAHDEIPAILQTADVFVLPSLNEGMSNAVLEAMACGLPVVVTDVGGSTELVEGNGYIVPKGNVLKLREAIQEYVQNPGLVSEHGRCSRERVEDAAWSRVASAYVQVYESIQKTL